MGIITPDYGVPGKPDQPEEKDVAPELPCRVVAEEPAPPPLRLNNRDLQQAILDTYDLWQRTTNATQGDVFYKHLNTLLGIQLIRARAGQGD